MVEFKAKADRIIKERWGIDVEHYASKKADKVIADKVTYEKYFYQFIYHRAEIRFIRGRIRFDGAVYNAPFPSMVVIFRGETA
jgi:site-specific DNA-methyltransferase (adenine-specific)